MGSHVPLDIGPEAQHNHGDAVHSAPHIDVIELHRSAHDRPTKKGSGHGAPEPKDFSYGSINDLLDSTVTDRKHRVCATDPKPGEVPILKPKSPSIGCEYTTAAHNPVAASIYKQHKDQTVIVKASSESGSRKGSGVMVEKGAGTCTILTDVHVTNGLTVDKTVSGMSVTTASGEKFSATLGKVDPRQDLALVTMQTGKETDRVCKPVRVAKSDSSTERGELLVNLGYPEASSSVYASPGMSQGKAQLITEFGDRSSIPGHPWVGQFSEVVRGENTGRAVVEQNAQVYPGNSGGPSFNRAGELAGVVSRTKGNTKALITPVSQDTIAQLKK